MSDSDTDLAKEQNSTKLDTTDSLSEQCSVIGLKQAPSERGLRFSLEKLLSLLKKLFSNQAVSEEEMILEPVQTVLLRSILKRKYKTLEYIDDQSLSVPEILEKVARETSRKRPEENQKFLFKRTIRFMKKSFKKKASKKLNKKAVETQFLDHYFKETSERLNIPLSCYLDPKNSTKSS